MLGASLNSDEMCHRPRNSGTTWGWAEVIQKWELWTAMGWVFEKYTEYH